MIDVFNLKEDSMKSRDVTITIQKETYNYLMVYVESYDITLGQLIDLYVALTDYPLTLTLLRKIGAMKLREGQIEERNESYDRE